jgi:hypothetical protein
VVIHHTWYRSTWLAGQQLVFRPFTVIKIPPGVIRWVSECRFKYPRRAARIGHGLVKSTLLAALAGAIAVGTVAAQDVEVTAAEVVGYGVFESVHMQKTTSGEVTTPQDIVENVRFVHFSNEIPALLGTEFGFQYVLDAARRNAQFNITYVIRFPEAGLVDPDGKTHREIRYEDLVPTGVKSLHGYGFDRAWELVSGEWVFEIWHGATRLISRTFTVTEVSPVPG